MADKRTGDPKDGAEHVGGGRFVPVAGVYGTEVMLPGPITPGPPKPEPEERWTLAPGHRAEPPAERGHVAEAPTERGPGRGRPAGEVDGEPGPA